jgi:hypothetical protein
MTEATFEAEHLLKQALQGDKESYRGLVRLHMPLVYALCWAQTLDPTWARRLAEKTFIAAYYRLWAAPRKYFRRWLHITFRETGFTGRTDGSINHSHPLYPLSLLPRRYREFVALHSAAGLSFQEIARTLRETPSAIRRAVTMLSSTTPAQGEPACPVTRRLPLLLDNDTPLGKKAQLEMHLLQCTQCSNALEATGRALAAFEAAFKRLVPGEESVQAIVQKLPDHLPAPPKTPPVVRVIAVGWLAALTGILLALLLRYLSG